ncbi:MAG: hypothetical protein L3K10_07805 [Thermoplasmata archaeon]|jgi:hypothetical protein|nr:hypothetical protein [Thermoplasmata archaeon]
MVDLSLVFLVLIVALDFGISIWNAYASGVAFTLLRGQSGKTLTKVAAGAGLGLAFAGMSYAMLIVFSFLAYYLGYLGAGDVTVVLAFDFLVFGAMIIGFGLVVTAQSVARAYRERSFGTIAISVWNVFAEVADVAIYASGFRSAYGTLGGARNRVNLYAIIILAVLVAFFITYAAYRHGVRRTEQILAAPAAGRSIGQPLPS